MRMLVAAHQAVEVPDDGFYLPVHVGHALNPVDLGFQADDEGENISALNPSYCELTALYWAWKNLDADAIGLSHYRRYFRGAQDGPSGSSILSGAEAVDLMRGHDVVVGRRRHYVVETIESHYRNAHHGTDLEALRDAVASLSPGMLPAYDRVFRGRSLSLYNMLLMQREELDRYAPWLFAVLAATAGRVEGSTRTSYQSRALGFLGERLLNVWLEDRRALRVRRLPVVNVDGEPVLRKGWGLLRRKAGLTDPRRRTS